MNLIALEAFDSRLSRQMMTEHGYRICYAWRIGLIAPNSFTK